MCTKCMVVVRSVLSFALLYSLPLQHVLDYGSVSKALRQIMKKNKGVYLCIYVCMLSAVQLAEQKHYIWKN